MELEYEGWDKKRNGHVYTLICTEEERQRHQEVWKKNKAPDSCSMFMADNFTKWLGEMGDG